MRKAVIIGINDYPGAPLTSCVNDAKAIAEMLRTNGDGSPNFDVKVYPNVKSRNKLTKITHDLFRGQHEIALLYFAGHGGKNTLDTFLVTPDAEEFDMGLSVTNLIKLANESCSKNRIVLLDCCYSGAIGSLNFIGDSASLLHKGVTILTASNSDEEAAETVNGYGVFTNLLLQALAGGAADISGAITSAGIYAYIDRALGAHDQRPVFKTNITEFTSIRTVRQQVAPELLRKLVTYFPRPDHDFRLDPSFEDSNTEEYEHKLTEPWAVAEHVAIFKDLQKYQSVGLVVPVDAPFMYFAAMEKKSCKLTALGQHYWRLVSKNRI